MILADLGADVIKVEPAGEGDMIRAWQPFDRGIGVYFLSVNRNKRSLAITCATRMASPSYGRWPPRRMFWSRTSRPEPPRQWVSVATPCAPPIRALSTPA